MTVFLFDGPEDGPALLLAHGAGAAMDSTAMSAIAGALAAAGLRVARFEFGYMAARREGRRRPPPRAETLVGEYRDAVRALQARGPLVIGGKSMGGRVASMVVDDLAAEGLAAGLLCLGYPFHPPAKPQQTRVAHLAQLASPALIVQGTRDPFGGPDDVAGYTLSPSIAVHWVDDGDHDLRSRRAVTGLSPAQQLGAVTAAVRDWMARAVPARG